LRKLGSLARLALSAAAQKRDFLRRHRSTRPEINRGFFLDRARLVVVPVGMDQAIRTLLGQSFAAGGPARAFAQQMVSSLQSVLQQDGQNNLLDACIDSAVDYRLTTMKQGDEKSADAGSLGPRCVVQRPPPQEIAGLTPWDHQTSLKDQLQAAGILHALAGSGTVALLIPEGRSLSAEELVDLLRYAWQQTEVVRVRLVRETARARQLTAPWVSGEA
jgi:hypothetical protein